MRTTKNSVRKLAQLIAPNLEECEKCGATENLSRHHPDYSQPYRFEILCRPCHIKADIRDGHRKSKATRPCAVCKTEFLPSHSKKHKTCSAACLSEIGRLNAEKRWGKASGLSRSESKAALQSSVESATASSRSVRSKSSAPSQTERED